ncbi:hypothetical protein Lal_00025901 [Lupinus albus]|nr:hypothetical protein Lal_00025901 [Lupinus albus]
MEQGRTKRVKPSATRVRRREVGSPSTRDRGDPYYSLIFQETRLAKFQGRKPTYIRYIDLTWLAEQNISFPHDMEAQGTVQFLELKGQVYPALVREFYANFRYKDGKYWSMISGNLFELNDDMFMNVGGLSSSGYGIGDCSWVKENFDPTERNTNHAQPTVNDLRFMYAVKNNSKLLPYSIFISRIVDYLHIDVSDTIIVEYTDKDHLVGESLIHKMGIYKYGTTWQYQEDYTTIGLDLSDDDNQGGMGDQHATTQGEPSGTAPHNSAFGLDQLEAMEQRLNNCMDLHFPGLKDSYFAGMEQYEERQTAYSDNQFKELRNMIQSTAEAQNAMFCSEFQKLSVLIRLIVITASEIFAHHINHTNTIFKLFHHNLEIRKEQRFLAGATPKERRDSALWDSFPVALSQIDIF